MRLIGQVIKHLQKDPASINLLFLHILPYSDQIPTDNTVKTFKYPFSYAEFL